MGGGPEVPLKSRRVEEPGITAQPAEGRIGAERSELLESLAAGIAHEVRNPLNSLQINLRILREELEGRVPDKTDDVFVLIEKIGRELTRLDDFVSGFLRYARPPQPKFETVPVRAMLSDLVSFLAPECAAKGIEMRLEADQGPPNAVVDPLQLKHALLNLLLNALQATPRSGRVVLRTGGDASELTIAVIDTGEGIPESVRNRMFSVFFSTREGGTGLGLPIVRRIIEEHGGRIAVESRPGRGTVVTIALPIRKVS